jgi:hypothetical protein
LKESDYLAMGLVAADSVEDTPLVVSQNDVDIRELAVYE